MIVILDNNLPWRMAKAIQVLAPSVKVEHLSALGMSDCDDGEIRRRLATEPVIWITRDEDFWLEAPASWAIVWVSCHNPRLSFLRQALAPAIGARIPHLRPGSRLLVSEDVVTLI